MNSVLVFGASGYVGTNLVPCLATRGVAVRAAARRRSTLEARGWPDTVEIVEADALAPDTLTAALQGIECAYYLVHSMAAGPDFPRLDLGWFDDEPCRLEPGENPFQAKVLPMSPV